MNHFYKNWTGKYARWIPVMEDTCYRWWKEHYLPLKAKEDTVVKELNPFELHLLGQGEDGSIQKDDFRGYARGDPDKITSLESYNPIHWWRDQRWLYPTISLWALDTLSIPAMSAECERVFSSAKKLITPERNALADDTIEACECLKAWWDQGLIRGQHDL
jgi:hypothetical protein